MRNCLIYLITSIVTLCYWSIIPLGFIVLGVSVHFTSIYPEIDHLTFILSQTGGVLFFTSTSILYTMGRVCLANNMDWFILMLIYIIFSFLFFLVNNFYIYCYFNAFFTVVIVNSCANIIQKVCKN